MFDATMARGSLAHDVHQSCDTIADFQCISRCFGFSLCCTSKCCGAFLGRPWVGCRFSRCLHGLALVWKKPWQSRVSIIYIYIYYSSVLYIQRSSSTEAWQLSWTMGGMRPSLIHRSCSRADATSHLDRLLHSIVVCLEKDIEQLGVLNVTI